MGKRGLRSFGSEQGPVVGSYANEPLGSIKCWESGQRTEVKLTIGIKGQTQNFPTHYIFLVLGYIPVSIYTEQLCESILSNILLSRLSPYIDEIIWDHRRGFRCNRSTTDQIFCIHQILEKKSEYNETVHQLFVDFKKAYDSVRREVLYNILIEFGVPMKLVRLIKMCLNETYSKVCIGKYLSDIFLSRMVFRRFNATAFQLCFILVICH
jgi:hypothetical protein